jgi:hypothetical protein
VDDDAVSVWEWGPSAWATQVHHVVRARTLTRLAASSVLCSYPSIEDVVYGSGSASPAMREDLARWLGRDGSAGDSAVVADAVLAEGPSW